MSLLALKVRSVALCTAQAILSGDKDTKGMHVITRIYNITFCTKSYEIHTYVHNLQLVYAVVIRIDRGLGCNRTIHDSYATIGG